MRSTFRSREAFAGRRCRPDSRRRASNSLRRASLDWCRLRCQRSVLVAARRPWRRHFQFRDFRRTPAQRSPLACPRHRSWFRRPPSRNRWWQSRTRQRAKRTCLDAGARRVATPISAVVFAEARRERGSRSLIRAARRNGACALRTSTRADVAVGASADERPTRTARPAHSGRATATAAGRPAISSSAAALFTSAVPAGRTAVAAGFVATSSGTAAAAARGACAARCTATRCAAVSTGRAAAAAAGGGSRRTSLTRGRSARTTGLFTAVSVVLLGVAAANGRETARDRETQSTAPVSVRKPNFSSHVADPATLAAELRALLKST
jgi:hypothetical protein